MTANERFEKAWGSFLVYLNVKSGEEWVKR